MIRAYLCRHIKTPDGGLTNPLLERIDSLPDARQPRAELTMVYPRGPGGVLRSSYCLVIAAGPDAETFASLDGVVMLPAVNFKGEMDTLTRTSLQAKILAAGFTQETATKVTLEQLTDSIARECNGKGLAPNRHTRLEKWEQWGG
jgi:hypothetical protein